MCFKIVSLVHIVLVSVSVTSNANIFQNVFMHSDPARTYGYIGVAIYALFIEYPVNILLSFVLLRSASKRSVKILDIWIYFTAAFTFISLIKFLVLIWANWWLIPFPTGVIGGLIYHSTSRPYFMWVVFKFKTEIVQLAGLNETLVHLSDEEVQEFLEGTQNENENVYNINTSDAAKSIEDDDDIKSVYAVMDGEAFKRPYSTSFEIAPHRFTVDLENPLGQGSYGIVYRSQLIDRRKLDDEDDPKVTPVAAKTLKSMADKTCFKALLCELKVMCFVGRNENVVAFLGACTLSVKEGKIFIFMEYCDNGSLDLFLKTQRHCFFSEVKNDEILPNSFSNLYSNAKMLKVDTRRFTKTTDLIRWAFEIASGMEFLASKRVIHGDLAVRNVLLDSNLTAKINDFGMARKLYQNPSYMKSTNQPLPWRWMAYEALKNLEFSIHSDVWSFGVTIWEIFSLAETPYPGQSWTGDYLSKLLDGMRMRCPTFSTRKIYDVMLDCWRIEVDARPTFTQLKEFFNELLSSFSKQCQTAGSLQASQSQYCDD